ncbi:MAG: hypothetical protein E6K91_08730 [Thaumarchaeota archaeon]|nr:MAG: hypothetical protein E6K91_08730 [Nitrososphaerota archaeon]
MRKFSVLVGLILLVIGIIFSVISWIVLIDTQSARQYPFGNLDGSVTGRLLILSNFVVFMPLILAGIPVMIHGFSEKFSERWVLIVGLVLLSGYVIFWLINGLVHPE